MHIRYLALAGASLLVSAAPAFAQDATETDGNVIVVTGRGLDAPPSVIAYSTITLDRDQLQSSASGQIEDVLSLAGSKLDKAKLWSCCPTSPASSSFAARTAARPIRPRKA